MEQELLLRLGLCVDPHKTAALGLSQRVKESFGIGVSGLSPKEQTIRNALWDKIRGEMKPSSKELSPSARPECIVRIARTAQGQEPDL